MERLIELQKNSNYEKKEDIIALLNASIALWKSGKSLDSKAWIDFRKEAARAESAESAESVESAAWAASAESAASAAWAERAERAEGAAWGASAAWKNERDSLFKAMEILK